MSRQQRRRSSRQTRRLTPKLTPTRLIPSGPIFLVGADNDADFNDIEAADAEADLDTYRREIVAARKAVAGKGLDEVVPYQWAVALNRFPCAPSGLCRGG